MEIKVVRGLPKVIDKDVGNIRSGEKEEFVPLPERPHKDVFSNVPQWMLLSSLLKNPGTDHFLFPNCFP